MGVVTQPDRPKGRGRKTAPSPVKQVALENNLEILQPEKASDRDFCEVVKKKAPDVIIVIAFGQILKKELLSIPGWGVINIHASLLPRYRGAAPIQRAIMNDESLTGLTVMLMDEGLDTGPILYQEEVPIMRDETAGELHDRLALKSGEMIVKSLRLLVDNKLEATAQDDSRATYAHKIEKDMTLIDWGLDAKTISAFIRALDPSPGAFTTLGEKRIKLFASRLLGESQREGVPGRAVIGADGGLSVETGRGLIEIGEIQYPGRKRLASRDFLLGFSLPEGTILGKGSDKG